MATISLTIPDSQLPRVRLALCTHASLDVTNANAKEALIRLVKDIVRGQEMAAAIAAQPPIPEADVTDIVS